MPDSAEDVRDDLFHAIEYVLLKHKCNFARDCVFYVVDEVMIALQDAGIVGERADTAS